MTRTIWKFPLDVTDQQVVKMPGDSQVLTVQNQNGVLVLWAIVDPESVVHYPRTVRIIGTGNPMPSDMEDFGYLCTVQQGPFAWHVFIGGRL